jgi:hypothetical protein
MTPDTPPIEPTLPSVPEEDAVASAEFARALDEFEQNKRSAAAAAGAAAEITVGMKVKGTVVSVGVRGGSRRPGHTRSLDPPRRP